MTTRLAAATAWALLALCAAPSLAAAAPTPLVDATVGGIATTGQFAIDGTLAAFRSTGDPDAAGSHVAAARLAPSQIVLHATQLVVDTDVQSYSGNPGARVLPDPHTEHQDLGTADAASQPARVAFAFFLGPLGDQPAPRVRIEAGQSALVPAADAGAEGQRQVPTSRPLLAGAAGPCVRLGAGVHTLHVEGDFALTLWDWDLAATNATTRTVFTSGATYEPTTPTVDGIATSGHTEQRQVFVYARGATLDATIPDGAAADVAVQPSQAQAQGRLTLIQPRGVLQAGDGSHALADGDWVEGGLQATFGNLDAGTFHLLLHGTPTAAHVQGQGVTFAPPESAPAAARLWLWGGVGLAGLLLAAAAGLALVLRVRLRQVQRAMDEGQYRLVVQRATPLLLRLPRAGDSVRAQVAVSHLLLGNPDDAARALTGWRTGPPATREYLWACVHALRGETREAAQRASACLAADPVLGRQLLGDPLLSTLSRSEPRRSEGYS